MNPLPQFAAIVDALYGRATTLAERTAIANSQLWNLDDGQLLEAVPTLPRVGTAPPPGQPDGRAVDRAAMTDEQKAACVVWGFQLSARIVWRRWNAQNKVAAARASADADPAPL